MFLLLAWTTGLLAAPIAASVHARCASSKLLAKSSAVPRGLAAPLVRTGPLTCAPRREGWRHPRSPGLTSCRRLAPPPQPGSGLVSRAGATRAPVLDHRVDHGGHPRVDGRTPRQRLRPPAHRFARPLPTLRQPWPPDAHGQARVAGTPDIEARRRERPWPQPWPRAARARATMAATLACGSPSRGRGCRHPRHRGPGADPGVVTTLAASARANARVGGTPSPTRATRGGYSDHAGVHGAGKWQKLPLLAGRPGKRWQKLPLLPVCPDEKWQKLQTPSPRCFTYTGRGSPWLLAPRARRTIEDAAAIVELARPVPLLVLLP
jgi:hypothetical protein